MLLNVHFSAFSSALSSFSFFLRLEFEQRSFRAAS